jgi:hypothetical protein
MRLSKIRTTQDDLSVELPTSPTSTLVLTGFTHIAGTNMIASVGTFFIADSDLRHRRSRRECTRRV